MADHHSPEFLQLVELLPPPKVLKVEAIDWGKVEQEIGVRFPDDYKHFCDIYGPGSINEFLWINDPRGPNCTLGELIAAGRKQLEQDIMALADEMPDDPALFDVNRLFPCGGTDNGDRIFWVMDGEPANWRIDVSDAKGYIYESGEPNLVSLLVALITKRSRLIDRVIHGDWFDSAEFIPAVLKQ